jgi:hypothetical protein
MQNGHTNVSTQEILESLLGSIQWGHAFIKEIYALSRSYKPSTGIGTMNADALSNMYVLVLTDDKKNPGVEFKFSKVEDLRVSFTTDLTLKGIVIHERSGNTRIEFSFGSDLWFRAREMSFCIMDQSIWGDHSIYRTNFNEPSE